MLLFKILSRFPLLVLHMLGWVAGWCAYLFSTTYRARFHGNARQAELSRMQVFSAVGEAGKLVLELPRLWLGSPVPFYWDGYEQVTDAQRTGRGLVFLTPHLGCFEITAQAYAQSFGEQHPMTVLYRPPRQAWVRSWVESARQRKGLLTAPTNLGGVKQMIKALKLGHAVGLLPDQVPPQGMGVDAIFFGKTAYTMTLSARLIHQTNAQVLLAWGERLSWGRGYVVHVHAMQEALPNELDAAVQAINQAMERLISNCPHQYLWGYARYKKARNDLEGRQ